MKAYCAAWVLPVLSPPLQDAAVVVEGNTVVGLCRIDEVKMRFPNASVRELGEAAIIPGLINAHSHLELTVMRGFLDEIEGDFFKWLRKLTLARQELTADDLYVSCAWGACEAVRAGVTCVADSSDSARSSMQAILDIGLRGIVFQESFGPDPKLAFENFEKLQDKVAGLRELQSDTVRVGVSPHAPYTVCSRQLELIARYAIEQELPLMMHAAESTLETELLQSGSGLFADKFRTRGIEWQPPHQSAIQYLADCGILETRPLLAHCINVNSMDLELIKHSRSKIAHCPRSNAKLGHGVAPLSQFLSHNIPVGLGSDSVAGNNSCDILMESRFAILTSRAASPSQPHLVAGDGLRMATTGGASALGLEQSIGALQVGFQADFAVVALDGVHQQPAFDPVTTLMFASSARDVILTVVAGKEVFAENEVKLLDEPGLHRRLREVAKKLGP